MALFSKILTFYVIGVDISLVVIWFVSHGEAHIHLLNTFLAGVTQSAGLPVALLFSLFQELQLSGPAGHREAERLSSKLDSRNNERSNRLAISFIKARFISVDASPERE